jgi:hypothetical protein
MEKELPWEEFFADHGLDLFVLIFKLTYYGDDIEYSVCNFNFKQGK